METSQSLAVESFSDSWLSNVNSFLDVHDDPFSISLHSFHEAIFEESGCMISKYHRYPEEAQNFEFNVPISESSFTLVHADQIFSRGIIKPNISDPSRINTILTSEPYPVMISSSSSLSYGTVNSAVRISCHFLERWRKLSKQILKKCFKHFCHEVRCSRKRARVNDIDRIAREMKSWSSPSKSTRSEGADHSSLGAWSDTESSIYEAVLHCKRSIEK
ncbi:putative Membrane-associated kinase regulator-like protein [Quillaja saponaria]|uniref:Membrane-associated kinase regulator-like protein n=1 Tax=Quillaja saponaria TaxID=32244 RepID=A0AAD7PDV8_QUISA|nr:putative Membrane-associated kinase regulator-like protein [Quillaja saponaria]KAJ7951210.1 putative Membrane-associated kinase regulator-like protein [Quillaja saponaria]